MDQPTLAHPSCPHEPVPTATTWTLTNLDTEDRTTMSGGGMRCQLCGGVLKAWLPVLPARTEAVLVGVG